MTGSATSGFYERLQDGRRTLCAPSGEKVVCRRALVTGARAGEACGQSLRRRRWLAHLGICTLLIASVIPAPASAQQTGMLNPVFDGVGVADRLGATVPVDLEFTDSDGRTVRIGEFLDGERPVLLNFVYHSCPMLCSILLDVLTDGLQGVDWTPGDEYQIVTVSISPADTFEDAARQKERYIGKLGRREAVDGWAFLTGTEENITALTEATGFGYRWMPESQEYAHPAALIFLAGDGRISRYVVGMDYPAQTIKLALSEAASGSVTSAFEKLALYCYRFDPSAGSYVVEATNLMRLGGVATVVLLAGVLGVFWRRERHSNRRWAVDPSDDSRVA